MATSYLVFCFRKDKEIEVNSHVQLVYQFHIVGGKKNSRLHCNVWQELLRF